MLKHSSLKSHALKKGQFITPFNQAFGKSLLLSSWAKERLPEYIWLGLIIEHYGRENAFCKIRRILIKLAKLDASFQLPMLSNVLLINQDKQQEFWTYVLQQIDAKVLEPLTVIYSFVDYPVFNKFFQNNMRVDECIFALQKMIEKSYDRESHLATDIMFCILVFQSIRKTIVLPDEQVSLLNQYPRTSHDAEIMRKIRPIIRSIEISLITMISDKKTSDCNQSDLLWKRMSVMTDCQLFCIPYEPFAEGSELYKEYLHEIFRYLEQTFLATEPLNQKYLVVLGLATFAYKRIKELVEHDLYNEIAGRNIARSLIEIYIMMKYLIKHQNEKDNIWDDYQRYGFSAYKMIVGRNRENPYSHADGHVNYGLLEILVNDYCNEEFVDIDTRYFGANIREKAKDVGEEELYGLIYDYDSSFEHGLWGAIRESSLLACNNPAHQFHTVLDCDDSQKMPSVWKDCVRVMNKILSVVDGELSIPVTLMDEVKKFE